MVQDAVVLPPRHNRVTGAIVALYSRVHSTKKYEDLEEWWHAMSCSSRLIAWFICEEIDATKWQSAWVLERRAVVQQTMRNPIYLSKTLWGMNQEASAVKDILYQVWWAPIKQWLLQHLTRTAPLLFEEKSMVREKMKESSRRNMKQW